MESEWYSEDGVVYERAPIAPRFIAACRTPEHAARIARDHNAHAELVCLARAVAEGQTTNNLARAMAQRALAAAGE